MNLEINRKVYKPHRDVTLAETSGVWRQSVGFAAADLVAEHPDLAQLEYFPGADIRQIVYRDADQQGHGTVQDIPMVQVGPLFVRYDLEELEYNANSDTDSTAFTQEDWARKAAEVGRIQDAVLHLYKQGDPAAMCYMLQAAVYTGSYHAFIAGERLNLIEPAWQPRMDINPPIQLIRNTMGQLLINSTSAPLPWHRVMANAFKTKENPREVWPILRDPNEKLTFIGGRMSTLQMLAFFRDTPWLVDIIPATQSEKWAALGAYKTMGKPGNVCVCENEQVVDEAFTEGCSTLLISGTGDTPEFDVEAAIYKAALSMQEYKGHPPQIVISENFPMEAALYERTRRALELCGYEVESKAGWHSNEQKSFLIVAHPSDALQAHLAGHFYANRPMMSPVRPHQNEVPVKLQNPGARRRIKDPMQAARVNVR